MRMNQTTRATIVQKFGGSSVGNGDKIRACAARAAAAARAGSRVAVVVSAMGDTTDELIKLAAGVSDAPDRREMDQLLATGEQVSASLMAMALQAMGVPAISLTGQQAGVRTEPVHTRARIRSIDTARLERELDAGKIAVVTGFQGVTDEGDVTTLGRGGSDTSAVALASALGAGECEIYTDVDGVYTADPRAVAGARLIDRISYDEMLEAASLGARVMHIRAVELGKSAGVPIRVLHASRAGPDQPGTLIVGDAMALEHASPVTMAALKTDIGRVTLVGLPDRAGVQREVFAPIAQRGISVDDIIQAPDETRDGSVCTLVFTVDKTDLAEVRPLVEAAARALGGEVRVDLGLAKVSVVGAGMTSQAGVAATMFRALGDAGVKIANITTSEIKISCIVPEADGVKGLNAVHAAFGLDRAPTPVVVVNTSAHAAGR
jgi:aspartate kinase